MAAALFCCPCVGQQNTDEVTQNTNTQTQCCKNCRCDLYLSFKFQKKGLSEGSQGKSLCIFTTESVRQVDRLEEDPPDPHNNSSR